MQYLKLQDERTIELQKQLETAAGELIRANGEASDEALAKSNSNWYINSVGITMLKISDGSFYRKNENPRSEMEQLVTLARPFFLSDREVSVDLMNRFMLDRDYPRKEKPRSWENRLPENSERRFATGNQPALIVLTDALRFCNWLSQKEGLTSSYQKVEYEESGQTRQIWSVVANANGYRLPTVPECEYTIQAGTETHFACGNDESLLDRYAVFLASQTEPCAQKLPNGWGLFDMHGNLRESCWDPDSEDDRVSFSCETRGGSFDDPPRFLRSNYGGDRIFHDGMSRGENNGFRVARTCD